MEDFIAEYERFLLTTTRHRLGASPDYVRDVVSRAGGSADLQFRDGVVQLSIARPPLLPELPASYGFKGGAARHALARRLALPEAALPIRDLDLVRLGRGTHALDRELAERHMPDDWAFGDGVEPVESMPGYMRSREITINQVAYVDGTLYCTPLALCDSIAGVLRPVAYRSGTLHRERSLAGKIALKMLRLAAELAGRWQIKGLPERCDIPDFHLALHLKRALLRGRAEAVRFLELCRDREYFFPLSEGGWPLVEEAVEAMLEEVPGAEELFASLPAELKRELNIPDPQEKL